MLLNNPLCAIVSFFNCLFFVHLQWFVILSKKGMWLNAHKGTYKHTTLMQDPLP